MPRNDGLALYRKQRRRRMTPEASLHIAVAEHLRLAAMPGSWFLHIPNEGKRSLAQGAHLKRLGMFPGAADLLIFTALDVCWLELKALGNRPTPEQIAFGELAKATGHRWAWADNINDALAILREFGALKPDAGIRRAA